MSEEIKNQPAHPKETLAIFRENFPAAFPPVGQPPKPLAIGIKGKVVTALSETETHDVIRALAWWIGSLAYQKALVAGGDRVDLDGNPTQPVKPAHQQRAAKQIELIKAKMAEAKAKRKAELAAPRIDQVPPPEAVVQPMPELAPSEKPKLFGKTLKLNKQKITVAGPVVKAMITRKAKGS